MPPVCAGVPGDELGVGLCSPRCRDQVDSPTAFVSEQRSELICCHFPGSPPSPGPPAVRRSTALLTAPWLSPSSPRPPSDHS